MVTMKTWIMAMVMCAVLYLSSSEAAECKSTGKACVRDCANMADGNYQSCSSCHVFIQCANHRTFVMPCPANLEWDDNAKRCVTKSNTCQNCDISADLMDKPGTCPPPDPFAMCLDACKTDYDCPGPLKCCFNGCGTVCGLQPGDTSVEVSKPGKCPSNPPHACLEMCSDDDQCPGPTKCCSTGCGHVCLPPANENEGLSDHPPSLAQQVEVYPENEAGQCPRNPGVCTEICSTDDQCPENMKCCYYPQSQCGYDHMCKAAFGDTSVEASKPGKCPSNTPHACLEMCNDDDQCPGPTKCCSTGCGHVCLPPASEAPVGRDYDAVGVSQGAANQVPTKQVVVREGNRPGMCPTIPMQWCSSCTVDEDCPGNWKCCYYPRSLGCLNYSCEPPAVDDDGNLIEPSLEVSAPEASMEAVRRSHVPRRKHCKSTGARCVDDCTGKKDGDYQSCHGCGVYVSCSGGRRYDDRPCAPGGLVWDDNKKRCEYNSSTCHGCLCPPPCHGTGPSCIRACAGLPNGNYQSCKACNVYVTCSNGQMYEGRPCAPRGTVWDDNCKVCAWWSDTCHPPRN